MPYWYTLAFEAHRTGRPLVRPLFFDAPDPSNMPPVEDAFRVGAALLVAPVVDEGAIDREVFLPDGTWYDFHTGKSFEGGRKVIVPAPLDRIPVFVLAGSVVPMNDGDQSELHLWVPTVDGEAQGGWLYDDEGDGHGPWRLDRFRLERNGPALSVTRESQGHGAASVSPLRLLVHGAVVKRLLGDGNEISVQGGEAMIPAGFHELRIELG
jgi:alpha-glucosidase